MTVRLYAVDKLDTAEMMVFFVESAVDILPSGERVALRGVFGL